MLHLAIRFSIKLERKGYTVLRETHCLLQYGVAYTMSCKQHFYVPGRTASSAVPPSVVLPQKLAVSGMTFILPMVHISVSSCI